MSSKPFNLVRTVTRLALSASRKTLPSTLLHVPKALCFVVLLLLLSACATPVQIKPVVGREYAAEIPALGDTGARQLSLKVDAAKLNNQPVPPQSLAAVELSEFNQALAARLATNSVIGKSAGLSSNQMETIQVLIEFAESEDFHAGKTGGNALLGGITLGLANPFLKHAYTYNCLMTLSVPRKEHLEKLTATGTATGSYVQSEMNTGFRSVRVTAREEAIRQILKQLE